jgi:exopolysaccharide biosynthesis protein
MRLVTILATMICVSCVLQPRTSTPIPVDSTWTTIAPGLEQRTYIPYDNALAQLLVLRIDPSQYTFRVHYRPGEALSLDEWREQIPNAAAFVNANFFDAGSNIVGLLVTDGIVYGQSYQDRGGTFLVQNGVPRVRSNLAEPYTGEPLEQAAQAFPMLVQDGVAAFTGGQPDRATRRTVVAQDANGAILLMVTPLVGLRLDELSAYLPTTDLNITNALNLDGGGSTMLYHQGINTPLTMPSFDPVPSVLAVYSR